MKQNRSAFSSSPMRRSTQPRLEILENRNLLTSGGLDPAFGMAGIAHVGFTGSLISQALAATPQSDGKLVVVGTASISTDGKDLAIARYNPDGSLDTSFGTGGLVTTDFQGRNDVATSVAITPDGKIIVAGNSALPTAFSTDPDSSEFALARYSANGTLDTTFGTGGQTLLVRSGQNLSDKVNELLVQPDGRIVVAGVFRVLRPDGQVTQSNAALVRYNVSGTLDPTFGTNGAATVAQQDGAFGLVRQDDGKLVAIVGIQQQLIRFTVDGALDTTYGSAGKANLNLGYQGSFGSDLARQADGKLIALGTALESSSNNRHLVVKRLNADGTFDPTFGNLGSVTVDFGDFFLTTKSVAVQSDAKILAFGISTALDSDQHIFEINHIVRLNTDGSLDSTYGATGKTTITFPQGAASAMTLDNGQAVLVGGSQGDFTTFRTTATGTADPSFGTNGFVRTRFPGLSADVAAKIAVQPDGKIVEVGSHRGVNSVDFAIARFNENGTVDSTFGTNGTVSTDVAGGDDAPKDVVVQPDGKILVFGYTSPGMVLVRYASDGSLDASFGTGGKVILSTEAFGSLETMALQVDQQTSSVKILLDGTGSLIRLNPDGSLDTTFGTQGKAPTHLLAAHDLVVLSDGRIVSAGVSDPTQDPFFAVARYTVNGQPDTTFGTNGKVRVPSPPIMGGGTSQANAVAIQPDGRILATGIFLPQPATNVQSLLALVRLNANGSFDTGFGAGGISYTLYQNDPGTAVVIQSDSRIVVLGGGRFNSDGRRDVTFGGNLSAESGTSVDLQVSGNKLYTAMVDRNTTNPDFLVARFIAQSTPNEYYVAQVYLDLLRRPADSAGLTFWAGQLDQGVSRTALATAFIQSAEYRTLLARDFYASFLHRNADPQGLAANVAFLNSGATLEQLKAQFLGSPEYLQTRGQNTTDGFLNALYGDILGRSVDATGRQAFSQALASGASRAAVALAVLNSREASQDLMGALYSIFLRRPADNGGLSAFTDALQNGMRSDAVIAEFVASDEYFGRA